MKYLSFYCGALLSLCLLAACTQNEHAPGPVVAAIPHQKRIDEGRATAKRVNARFAVVAPQCRDGKPAYYCDGVLIRGVSVSDKYHAWDPSPSSEANGATSFSYLRADIGTDVIFGAVAYLFRPLEVPSTYQLVVRCAYPYDAGTSNVAEPCTVRGDCLAEGITTYEKWVAAYGETGKVSCAFSPTPQQFQLSIDVRRFNPAKDGYFNELIVQTWKPGIPEQLPLEAIVYRIDVDVAAARKDAQTLQRDFHDVTGGFLPILEMDLKHVGGVSFAFHDEDQTDPEEGAGTVVR